jgi:hypothetical protein
MKKLNFPVILTVILNALIVIGVGHGLGCLLIYEILSPKFILDDGLDFTKVNSYDERLLPVAFLSLIFQILLLISLKVKTRKLQKALINIFCIALILVFLFLIKDFSESNLNRLSFMGGIPFLISSIILLIRMNFISKV